MVGFFPGFKMPFHTVNTIASRVWARFGLENVMTTTSGFMIFRFKTKEAMHMVLEKGPWMFGGKTIILQQWHPHYVFDKNKISKLPVWIRLHGLPFPLWSKTGLSLAASMAGRPLSCDEQTYNCTRLDYARVCVEVDASLPFIHQFEMESSLSEEPISIQVEYEWRPPRCEKCGTFGHVCPAVNNHKDMAKEEGKVIDNLQDTSFGPGTLRAENKGASANIQEHLQKPTTLDEHRVILHTAGATSSNKVASRPAVEICALQATSGGNNIEKEYGSENDSDNDPQLMEENQHLITGFPPCIESRIVTFASCSEASTSAKDTSLDTSSTPRGTTPSPSQTKKKKGKKMRKAKGQ